jgi:hypothetical protein
MGLLVVVQPGETRWAGWRLLGYESVSVARLLDPGGLTDGERLG